MGASYEVWVICCLETGGADEGLCEGCKTLRHDIRDETNR